MKRAAGAGPAPGAWLPADAFLPLFLRALLHSALAEPHAALALLSAFLAWRGRLEGARWLLWLWMLAVPFPYVATTAGWITAEAGRQPWIVHGLLRTDQATSPLVGAGDTLFTLIGFTGLYLVVGILFLFLIGQEIAHGPPSGGHPTLGAAPAGGRA